MPLNVHDNSEEVMRLKQLLFIFISALYCLSGCEPTATEENLNNPQDQAEMDELIEDLNGSK